MAKVLLVEDDNNLREIYEARLQAEGYQIATARDGEEALVVAKQEHPDLVISDVMMPKISGFEMLDILRNTDGLQAVKVIMLTALGQNDDQERADKLGADRYLVKSQVTLEDIVRVAHELLGDTPAAAASTPPADDSSATPPSDMPVADPPADPPAAPDTPEPEAPAPEAAPTVVTPTETPLTSPDDDPTGSVTPSVVAAEVANDAASTAQETAAIDAKIEDFVSGASSDTSTPETPVSEAPAAETPATTEAPASDAASSDDKLLADAVDNLVKNTTENDPAPAAPADPSTAPVLDAAPETKAAKGGSVGGSKVIKPLADEPKTDINTLAAKESAKPSVATPPPAGGPVVNDVTPPTPAAPAAEAPVSNDPNDPSNIAL
jgi:CheY-like chemotaxis protein